MFINLKAKIWLTILAIVLLFTFFTLYYFPEKQRQALLINNNNELQNLAKSVALGVEIALNDENFEGIKSSMDFAKETPGFKFISLISHDTVWNKEHTQYKLNETIVTTYPENIQTSPHLLSNDSMIVKRAPFKTTNMSGAVMGVYTTSKIAESLKDIRITSLIVSIGIFAIGLLLGMWLARNISKPVRALRDAAQLVGKGDLTTVIKKFPNDEIGDLSKAFNNMVQDISKARDLYTKNLSLSESNDLLNATLADLKATQNQLIQSEKMASLGELTAGIAHEIQNPLNFVNNFSEVNTELIEELQQEQKKESRDFKNEEGILKDIKENEQKINYHGKRAGDIVKNMLQHSRSSSGKKEPTDINKLADEYLRLAYHGLRAKDKSFNATIKTDFDPTLEKINIIPQDIGRVVLNLLTNAFYVVNEKTLSGLKDPTGLPKYEPTVSVTTKKSGDKTIIKVSDNGNGIPQKILDKIFQPFFTTKPTGQGTGLGLSLSYDIVTKGHGGELKVETKEGEGTSFIISLPA